MRWLLACALVAAHPARAQLGAPGSAPRDSDAGGCDIHVDGPGHTCSLAAPGFYCFSGCNEGKLNWTNWTDPNEQGVLVQFSRPTKTDSGLPLGPRGCVKLVITEARNVLGYILDHRIGAGCGERSDSTGSVFNWDDPAGGPRRVSWFNASGANATQRFELALLNDVDQSGTSLQLTLRPNPLPHGLGSNDTSTLNFSYVKFAVESCNMTAPVTDRALFLTATLDLIALLVAFLWVTCSWSFFGQIRHWHDIRESRRQSTTRATGIDDDMLHGLLRGQDAAMGGGEPQGGDEDESESQHAVLRRRARQRAWRADFMAKHRFTWPYYVWVEPDSTIGKIAGRRALQYMEFQWAMIRLLLGLCIPMTAVVIVNWQGKWCQDTTTKAMTTVVNPKWDIAVFDAIGSENNDLLCRLSSNNIADSQTYLLWVHLGATILFSILTYAVSKRDILRRTEENSVFLKLFRLSKLDMFVPEFWQWAHCRRSTVACAGPVLHQDETAVGEDGGGGLMTSPEPAPEPATEPVGLPMSRAVSPQRQSNVPLQKSASTVADSQVEADGVPRQPLPVGVSRAVSPERRPTASENLGLASRVQGGSSTDESHDSTGARSSTSGNGGNGTVSQNFRQTGFEWAHNLSPERLRGVASSSTKSSQAGVDRHRISPARHALMVRRVSTRYEADAANGWLRSTLYRVFHRPPEWNVIDILVFRSSKWDQCTAFIVFESPETPVEIIRRHRDAAQQGWLAKINICCRLLAFFCPKLPCKRVLSSTTDAYVFGWSPDTNRLGMPEWDLQPGPMKEDLEVRLQKKGRMRHLNRPEWQRTASVFIGTTLLIMLSAVVICSSTLMEPLVKGYNNALKATATNNGNDAVSYDAATGTMRISGASYAVNFFASYLPTLINFVVIVGILPTLIDFVAYVIEPHYLKSDVHRSVLRKNLGLLLVSSLIFPSLALRNLQMVQAILFQMVSRFMTLAELASDSGISVTPEQCTTDASAAASIYENHEFLQWAYSLGSYPLQILIHGFGSAFSDQAAGYFYRYITHASLLGLGSQLMLMPDKFYTVLSCVCCLKDEKKLVWEFPLEYNYAYFCSTLAIVLVYSIPHPPILLLGLFYASMRAFGDKYALLFAHEGNLDSHFTDAAIDDDAAAEEEEGVHSSEHYHARTLNLTVHHFLLASIALFQVAMYGFLSTDPNSSKDRFGYAWVALLLYFCTAMVFVRRMCSRRATKMEANSVSLPEATVEEGSAMPDAPSGFGYYNDDGTDMTIDPTGSIRLTQTSVSMTRVDGWTQR